MKILVVDDTEHMRGKHIEHIEASHEILHIIGVKVDSENKPITGLSDLANANLPLKLAPVHFDESITSIRPYSISKWENGNALSGKENRRNRRKLLKSKK